MSHDPHHPDPHLVPHHGHETPPLHDVPDEWHDHSHDEKPQHAHAEVGNAALITGIGVGLFMAIVVSVIAVYGYYTWFITERIRLSEIATSESSPAIAARKYKSDAYIHLAKGGNVVIPASGDTPASNYRLTPIDESIQKIAEQYTKR